MLRLFLSLWLLLLLLFCPLKAQSLKSELKLHNLPVIHLKEGVTLHVVSPEPLEFVDLSTNHLEGDLPSDNIVRIKVKADSLLPKPYNPVNDEVYREKHLSFIYGSTEVELGIITLVGKSFMAQYRCVLSEVGSKDSQSSLHIMPEHMQPLEFSKLKLSYNELKDFSESLLRKPAPSPLRKKKEFGMKLSLLGVYVLDDQLFLEVEMENRSALSFDLEKVEISLDDKKVFKSMNSQSVPLKVLYAHSNNTSFRRRLRTVYVLEKVSFPSSKVLSIRLIEKGLSTRNLKLEIPYSEVLNADTL